MLADGLRKPCRPRRPLHGAGEVGRTVEGSRRLDEGVELRATRRRVGVGQAIAGLNHTALG